MPLISRTALTRLSVGAAAALTVAAAVGFGFAADEADTSEAKTTNEVRIGTYEPQAVFQSYHKFPEFNSRLQELQMQMQTAHQEGDQQRAFMLQQQMQSVQNEAVTAFIEDVDRAMPKVATEAEVHVVALEVVYVAEGLAQPKDLTQAVIAELNKDAAAQNNRGEQPVPPPFPE